MTAFITKSLRDVPSEEKNTQNHWKLKTASGLSCECIRIADHESHDQRVPLTVTLPAFMSVCIKPISIPLKKK